MGVSAVDGMGIASEGSAAASGPPLEHAIGVKAQAQVIVLRKAMDAERELATQLLASVGIGTQINTEG